MDACVASILERAVEARPTADEALELLRASEGDPSCAEALYAAARAVRREETGDVFHFSGGVGRVLPCRLDLLCLYCPYWRGEDLETLSVEDIVEAARAIEAAGMRGFHLSGGTTPGSDGADILEVVQAIWDAGVRAEVYVNCGAAMNRATLLKLRELGVVRVGSTFETTDPEVFAWAKPGDSLEEKLRFAREIGEAGLEVGSGMMAGLGPVEGRDERYVKTLYDMVAIPRLTSVYISKFKPDPTIPMRDEPACSLDEGMRLMAVARLVLRGADVSPAAGWSNAEREMALDAGAGAGMFAFAANKQVNYWPDHAECEHREGRLTYRDRRDEMRSWLERRGLTLR